MSFVSLYISQIFGALSSTSLCFFLYINWTTTAKQIIIEIEEWRIEDGGWRMEDGRWRIEDEGWRVVNGGWRMEDGG